MSDDVYQTVLNLVLRLSTDEQFHLLEDLAALLRKGIQPQHSTFMSNNLYRIVFSQVRQLPIDEQFRLLADLPVMLQKGITRKPKHKITELEGLGKEIWQGIDVEEYIRQSRGPHEPENAEIKIHSSLQSLNQ